MMWCGASQEAHLSAQVAGEPAQIPGQFAAACEMQPGIGELCMAAHC
jgi:hypothetical protein